MRLEILHEPRKRQDQNDKALIGLAFVITNYLKGFFFALFPDFSIDVRKVLSISKSGKIIGK